MQHSGTSPSAQGGRGPGPGTQPQSSGNRDWKVTSFDLRCAVTQEVKRVQTVCEERNWQAGVATPPCSQVAALGRSLTSPICELGPAELPSQCCGLLEAEMGPGPAPPALYSSTGRHMAGRGIAHTGLVLSIWGAGRALSMCRPHEVGWLLTRAPERGCIS